MSKIEKYRQYFTKDYLMGPKVMTRNCSKQRHGGKNY